MRFVHGCILPCDTKEICGELVTELRQMSPWPCDWPDWLTLQMQQKWAGCIFCFRHQHTTGTIYLLTQVRNKPKKSSSVGNTAWGKVAGRETACLGVDRYLLSIYYLCKITSASLQIWKDTHFYVLFAIIKMDIFPSVLMQHVNSKVFMSDLYTLVRNQLLWLHVVKYCNLHWFCMCKV